LPKLDADDVGAMVVQAVRDNRFFLPTHAEVHDVLRQRAADPEGFLQRQIDSMMDEPGGAP
jgi:hypothetical protein